MHKKTWRVVRLAVAAVVMLTAVLAFGGWRFVGLGDGGAPAAFFAFQGENLLARLAAALTRGMHDHALAAGLGLFALLLVTWLFGRFYCGALCPLGIIQDALAWLARRPGRPLAPEGSGARAFQNLLPFLSLGAVVGFLLAGRAFVVSVLGPYAYVGGFLLGWLLAPDLQEYASGHPLAVLLFFFLSPLTLAVVGLSLWRPRFVCQFLCPVGAMLRLAAARGRWRLQVGAGCVGCGRCARVCNSECIDFKNRTIDDSRCVRCGNCVADCPRDALRLAPAGGLAGAPGEVAPPLEATPAPTPSAPAAAVADPSRRELLYNGAVAAGACVAAWLWARGGSGPEPALEVSPNGAPLPPGAMSIREFAARCTHCNLCAGACPTGVIFRGQPLILGLGAKACAHDCRVCSQVCPTGALRPLTLEQKQRLRIAKIVFAPAQCLAFSGNECCRCADACPNGAMSKNVSPTGFKLPRLDPARCIGCGACVVACPANPRALTVEAVARQEFIA